MITETRTISPSGASAWGASRLGKMASNLQLFGQGVPTSTLHLAPRLLRPWCSSDIARWNPRSRTGRVSHSAALHFADGLRTKWKCKICMVAHRRTKQMPSIGVSTPNPSRNQFQRVSCGSRDQTPHPSLALIFLQGAKQSISQRHPFHSNTKPNNESPSMQIMNL
jgi:hypothetical protein